MNVFVILFEGVLTSAILYKYTCARAHTHAQAKCFLQSQLCKGLIVVLTSSEIKARPA